MANRQFQVENEYRYSSKGAVRWILSHLIRYPLLPLLLIFSAVVKIHYQDPGSHPYL